MDTVAFPDGSFAVAVYLSDDAHPLVATNQVHRFGPDGERIGPPIIVNSHSVAESRGPGMDVFLDGRFMVAWRDSFGNVFAKRFDIDGTPLFR